jgi:hypothetical protein
MKLFVRRFLLVFSVCAAWALISWAPLYRYLNHDKAAAALSLGVLFIALGMHWLDRLNRSEREIGVGWFLLLFVLLASAFAVLYPISLKSDIRARSDREDALHVELSAVRQHHYPYEGRTFLGNPPTPLPGAMLLATPFFAIGHIAWQNLLWLALFILFAVRYFRHRATALFFLVVFVLLAPANLSDFTSGGDYLTNFIYFAIAIDLFVRTLDRTGPIRLLSALFLGVTLSSRVIYPFALIPLLALSLQRTSRARTLASFAVVLATAAAVTLPFFAPHPLYHLLLQLDQNGTKLRYIPSVLHPRWTLPLLAVAAGCSGFWVRMDVPRLLLTFCGTSLIVLAPFVVSFAITSVKLRFNFSYLSVCALSFALWALSRYEGMPDNVHSTS